MGITERDRHQMVQAFENTWGSEVAMTVAAHLPPVGWADVATKSDVEHLATLLRLEMATGLAGVRTEIHDLGADVRTEMHGLGTELRTEMNGLRVDLQQEMRRLLWMIIIAFVTSLMTFAGLLLAVVAISKP